MEIPVLEALKEAENGNFDKLTVHIETQEIWQIFKDIKDLLERQREKCHENAFIVNEGTYGSDGQSMEYYVVDRDSILNAKLF
jgi:hypothetical protein